MVAMSSGIRSKRPNFLIVGAAKSGTTSIYAYLRQHPDIFMPAWKELSLFSNDPHTPLHKVKRGAYYQAVFAPVTNQSAIGEASTCYLYDSTSPDLIRHHLGRIKVIISLRNPVHMAYSLYNHQLRKEGEHLTSFAEALTAEEQRMSDKQFQKSCYGWHANYYYYHRGLYTEQVKRYYETFGKQNVLVLLFDDLVNTPLEVARKTYRFLGVDEAFVPNLNVYNKGGKIVDIPRFWSDYGLFLKTVSFVFSRNLFRKLLLIIQKKGLKPALPIPAETARELAGRFRADITMLEQLIDRDLSQWKYGG